MSIDNWLKLLFINNTRSDTPHEMVFCNILLYIYILYIVTKFIKHSSSYYYYYHGVKEEILRDSELRSIRLRILLITFSRTSMLVFAKRSTCKKGKKLNYLANTYVIIQIYMRLRYIQYRNFLYRQIVGTRKVSWILFCQLALTNNFY